MGQRRNTVNFADLYRHEPYDVTNVYHVIKERDVVIPVVNAFPTLHSALTDRVTFVPYPAYSVPVAVTNMPKEQLARVFIGQLPYGVTDMQINWMVHIFGEGRPIFNVERIIKWNNNHQPKGCVHAYCYQEDADAVIALLNRKILFDDAGVWYANGAAEQEVLEDYCADMKHDPKKRFRDRPYQPVVVQRAQSTFVPRCPTPPPQQNAAPAPPAYHASHHAFAAAESYDQSVPY